MGGGFVLQIMYVLHLRRMSGDWDLLNIFNDLGRQLDGIIFRADTQRIALNGKNT